MARLGEATMVAITSAVLAIGCDRWRGRGHVTEQSQVLIASSFVHNPILDGWAAAGHGARWIRAADQSGRHVLTVPNGSWRSPILPSEPWQWYQLTFCARALAEGDGAAELHSTISFTNDAGEEIGLGVDRMVRVQSDWRVYVFRFRGRADMDNDGTIRQSNMAVEFRGASGTACVGEFRVEKLSTVDMEVIEDRCYGEYPVKLSYLAKETRWGRITRTIEKLRARKRLRILLWGAGFEAEFAAAPIDVFLQRLYPGSTIELLPWNPLVRAGGGFEERFREFVSTFRPDLLILGAGEAQRGSRELESCVNIVREQSRTWGNHSEILLVTYDGAIHSSGAMGYRAMSDMWELDQEPENNRMMQNDYRWELMTWAAKRGIEFLDVMGIVGEHCATLAREAGKGASGERDGAPFSYGQEATIALEGNGSQIIGRILEAYFSPDGRSAEFGKRGRMQSKKSAVRVFDPSRDANDLKVFEWARKEFGARDGDNPVVAVRARDDAGGGSFAEGVRVSGKVEREKCFVFDEVVDVRDWDVNVCWSFRSDQDVGGDDGGVAMRLCYSDPAASKTTGRMAVSLFVPPVGASTLSVQRSDGNRGIEELIDVPVENFSDTAKTGKFRVLLRWKGGDRVVVEAFSWDARANRWQAFVPADRPGAPSVEIELSIREHMMGNPNVEAVILETKSDIAILEGLLVTKRPTARR